MRILIGFGILIALVATEYAALMRGGGIFAPVFCYLLGFCFCLLLFV